MSQKSQFQIFFLEWFTPYTQVDNEKDDKIEKDEDIEKAEDIEKDETEKDQVPNSEEPEVTNNAYENAPNNSPTKMWVFPKSWIVAAPSCVLGAATKCMILVDVLEVFTKFMHQVHATSCCTKNTTWCSRSMLFKIKFLIRNQMDLILNQLTLAQKTNSELLSKITAMEKNQVRFKF